MHTTTPYLCPHCATNTLATAEVTWREVNEGTEDEPYSERSELVCEQHIPTCVESARSFYALHGEPTVERFDTAFEVAA